MSGSPLEGRIRALAREEVASLLGAAAPDNAVPDRVAELQAEIAELRTRLDVMEKAAGQTGQEPAAAARRTRKASGE